MPLTYSSWASPRDLHGRGAAQRHQLQALDDVMCHHLHREVGARTVAGAVVRCRVDEQVGESGYGAAAVRARTVAPYVGELLPTPTANVDRGQEIQVVPGGIDDHVEVDLPTIRRDNAACVDDSGLAGFHVDVITGQCRVVAAGITDDALSVGREVRRDLLRQFTTHTEGSVDVVQAHLQQHVVGRRDGQVVGGPFRIPQDHRDSCCPLCPSRTSTCASSRSTAAGGRGSVGAPAHRQSAACAGPPSAAAVGTP